MSYLIEEETGRLVFRVKSTTRAGETRVVDLCELEGNGSCDCWVFKGMRSVIEQDIKAWELNGGQPGTYEPREWLRCVHITACVHHVANRLVQQIRKAFPDDNSKGQAT